MGVHGHIPQYVLRVRCTMGSGRRIVALSLTTFSFIVASCPVASAFVAPVSIASHRGTSLRGSFFDDLFGNNNDAEEKFAGLNEGAKDDENVWDASGLAAEIERRNTDGEEAEEPVEEVEFDGYALRDAILNKFGVCWDVDFQRVESYGFRKVYLNILPFKLGSRKFRHASEWDYLCHLQAIVEILQKYDLLDSVLAQLEETKKKPRPGTSPLVAVPLRLDLAEEQIDQILGPKR